MRARRGSKATHFRGAIIGRNIWRPFRCPRGLPGSIARMLSAGYFTLEESRFRDLIIAPKTISGIIVAIIAIHIQSGVVAAIVGSVIP